MKETGNLAHNQYRQYEDDELIPVRADDVPVEAADYFRRVSDWLVRSPKLEIDQFDNLFRLDRDDGVVTYFAVHDKYYEHIDTTDRAVYLVDLLPDGEELGNGELFLQLNTDDAEPVVMRNQTVEKYRQRGYGTNRLLAMNAVALHLFGKPLRSDSILSAGAVGAWEHLVEAKLAERYTQRRFNSARANSGQYRFKR